MTLWAPPAEVRPGTEKGRTLVGYVGSYLWSLRQRVGSRPLLVPGAQILLLDGDGRALFQQRADSGVWELPAGACEEGDDFADTAVRELAEETGLRVDRADLIPFASLSDPGVHTLTYPNGDVTHCFALCFLARTWSGELVPGPDEVLQAEFRDPDDPPAPLHPPTAVVLDMFREFSATGRFQAR
ncbi:NUDIX domain-containing protein [Streptomyces jumonjinensis]|uniref:NUDIX domain-containing protein n=1 Tax=Streptomyces jumonjinensis TaxID=1945 RepID=UPI002B207552|nr:NUDIX domain-containing protein [Streptomyces jumonjinensis]